MEVALGVPKVFLNVKIFFDSCVFVGENFFPLRWAYHVESHFSFEVGLVKACEDSVGIIRFKLCVDVLFFIDINETHTAASVIVV